MTFLTRRSFRITKKKFQWLKSSVSFFSRQQNSNLSDYDLNSPDILCSPTNFSDIYLGGARNLSLISDLGGAVDPECSDNSNEGSMQVSQ